MQLTETETELKLIKLKTKTLKHETKLIKL